MLTGRRRILLIVFAVLAMSACGGNDPEPSETTTAPVLTTTPAESPTGGEDVPNLVGSWEGSYSSMLGATGTFQIQFTQEGNQIQGSIQIEGSTCVNEGDIAGTLSGNEITFGAVKGDVTITFSGQVDGAHMEGEYDAPDPACSNDSGTWEADRLVP